MSFPGSKHRQRRRSLVRWGVLTLLVAVCPVETAAQASLTARVDTTEIHVGDPVRVSLQVDHPRGTTVVFPDSLFLAPFEVLAARVEDPRGSESGLRTLATLTVTSFELGELDLPSLAVVVRDSTGSDTLLRSDPFRIGVVSVGLDESGDIRDIKGPVALARSWGPLLLWLVLVVLILGAMRWWWVRRSTDDKPAPVVPRAPPRPFHELAYEALAALEASTLLDQGRVKEFHIRLSEIIRSYIEGQLRVPAMELTTTEVVDGLRRAALDKPLCERCRTFLERCDLVKFAKFRPASEDSLALLADARELVALTSGLAGRGPTGDATTSESHAVAVEAAP
ncbi:MAG: hypothetical protein OEO23_15370 [Gemmatimonadota bacterium]|nr:hypothetical protein [Gemmatimonadota bacterium]